MPSFKKLISSGSDANLASLTVDGSLTATTLIGTLHSSVALPSGQISGNISAASAPWTGITGKPTTFTPTAHTHDDRYYTESEINTKLTNSGNWDTAYNWGNHASAGYLKTYVDTNTQRSDEEIQDVVGALVKGGGATTVSYDDVANTLTISSTDTDTNTWRPVDDTPRDGQTGVSISSNWAFDNVKTAVPANAVFTDTVNTFDGAYSSLTGTPTIPTNTNQLTNGAGFITSFTNTVDMGDGFIIANYAGIDQFTVTENEKILIRGTGATSVAFDASTNKVTISSTDTEYSVGNGGLTEINFTSALNNKLAGIAEGANLITNNNQLTNGAGYITSYVNTQRTDEEIRDVASAQWVNGTNTTVVKDDTANTIKINSVNTDTVTSVGTSGLETTGKVTFVGSGATQVSQSGNTVTITSTDTNTDTNTTYSAGNALTLDGTTFHHSDTSAQGSVNNSGRTYIQDITLDTYGHITGIISATETVVNTDTNTQRSDEEIQDVVGALLKGAGATTVTYDDVANTLTISSTDNNTQLSDAQVRSKFSAGTNVSISTAGVISSTDTNTVYTHPGYTARSIDTSGPLVLDVFTSDAAGHVTNITTRTLTLGELGFTGATDANNITNNNQLTNGAGYLTSSGTIANANYINVDEANGNTNYQVLFSTTNAAGYQRPYIDTDNSHMTYNPSTQLLTVGNINITGTTTTNNVEVTSTSNGVIFEGTVADANDVTLLAAAVTAPRTIYLPDAAGTVALTKDLPTNNNQLVNGAGYITTYVDTWRGIHDTPVDGATTTSISSNWAFDNVKTAVPTGALFTDTNTQLSDAQVRSKFSAGTNVQISATGVISSTDTNTNTQRSDEEIQDVVGALLKGAGATTVSYDDVANTLTISSTDTNTNTTYTAGNALTLSGTVFHHSDTSTQGSVNNSGRTYIQDITLDDYGHITGITSATETVVDTDTWRPVEEVQDIVGALLKGAGATTVTYDDAGNTITISSTDTNTDTNNYLNSASFNTGNGILTLGRSGLGDITVDLDGRFTDNGYADTMNQHVRVADAPQFARLGVGQVADAATTLTVYGNGGTVLDIQGSQGQLFSVTDDLTGDLFSVADISGVPIFNVNASGTVSIDDTLEVAGSISSGDGTSTNWKAAYDNYITGISISGTSTKTITLTQRDGGTISGAFTDIDTNTDTNTQRSDEEIQDVVGALIKGGGATTVTYDDAGNTLTISSTDTNTDTWRPVDDTPRDGQTAVSISSNWAFDNVKTAVPAGALFTDTNTWRGIDDTPRDGQTGVSISSNWAFDNVKTPVPVGAVFTDTDTNTTYSVGDGGLTQVNFTTTRRDKLDGIAAGANNITNNNQLTNGAGYSTYSSNQATSTTSSVQFNTVRATGDIVAYFTSDERLKENIKPIENASEKIKQIGGYTYDWNDKQDTYEPGTSDMGVIAQEIEKVAPELVTNRDNGFKAVKYEKLVALLIQSNKELLERVENLEAQLNKK